MKALQFEHITFGYRKDKILFKDLTFEITQPIGKGFVIGVMGASGSGKTTLLKLILGIEKPFEGKISLSPSNPVISYVPQEPVLFEHLTPQENAAYFNRISNYKSKFNSELFDEIAKILKIEDVLLNEKSVNEISGGQRQRISLLRALSIQPDILLLDEPLTGLDEEVKDQFLQTLATLIQRYNLMVIYVTHYRKEAKFISDTILYLNREKEDEVVTSATQTKTKIFFNNPPSVAALNATKDVRVNALRFRHKENGMIEPTEAKLSSVDPSIRLMSFQEGIIQFSAESGFEFEVIAETGTYTLLKLKDTQIVLTIDNELIEMNSAQKVYISFTGPINLFDYNGNFLEATEIHNNQITE